MNAPKLTEDPVKKLLVNMTIPMIFGMIGMVAFTLVDTYFVGQLGTEELAAISFTIPVIMTVMSLSIGLGIGATAVISRAIGSGNHQKVQRLTTDTLILSFIIVAILAAIGLATIDPLFALLGASKSTIELIRQYMVIWYSGVIFVIIPMVGNSIIRATGDMKTPSIIMLIAVFINLVLDPLLIFGIGPFPHMGLTGAALATLISRFLTLLVAIWVLYFRDKMITFKLKSFKDMWISWKEILHIGIPTSLSRMVYPIGLGVIVSLIAGYGEESVAAYGVASRLEFFAFTVLIALAMVTGPFVGQNFAAGKIDRVRKGMKYMIEFSFIWGALIFLLFAAFGGMIASVFNGEPLVIDTTYLYLLIVPITYGFAGIGQIASSALNVLGRPYTAASIIVVQMFVVNIPLAIVGSHYFGLTGIFASVGIAFIASGSVGYLILKRVLR